MYSLKLNISLSLILLLATGMLLTNAIITTLWQHSIISAAAKNNQTILEAIAYDIGKGESLPSTFLVHLTNIQPNSCSSILINKDWKTFSQSECETSDILQAVIEKASQSRTPVIQNSGKSMGVFWFQNKYLHVAVPLSDPHLTGAVGISTSLPSLWQNLRENQKIILVYILVNTIVLAAIGFFRLSSIIIRPIDRLVQATHDYSTKQKLGFVSELDETEFRQLSSAINSMVQRIDKDKVNLKNMISSLEEANQTIQQNQQEMVRTEKLASVGRLSAGLAHEIGNPLGIVLGYLGLLQKENLSQEERLDYIQRSERELNRINTLVRQLLDFSRPLSSTKEEKVHVHAILYDIIEMLQSQKKNQNITFTANLQRHSDIIWGNKEALRQAFVNFFLNAIDAIQETPHPDEGTITVESIIVQNEQEKKMLQVSIIDNGCGIPPGNLENIFDPFYTTKDPGKGTGLGLSVSFGIIEKLGGTIDAKSSEDKETTFRVKLPLATQASMETP